MSKMDFQNSKSKLSINIQANISFGFIYISSINESLRKGFVNNVNTYFKLDKHAFCYLFREGFLKKTHFERSFSANVRFSPTDDFSN